MPARATLPVHVVPHGSSQPNGSHGLPPSRGGRVTLKPSTCVRSQREGCRACKCRCWHPPVSSSLTRDTDDTAINLLAQTGKRFCSESSSPGSPASGRQSGPWGSGHCVRRAGKRPARKVQVTPGSPRKCHGHGGLQGLGTSCMHGGPEESERRRSHTTAAGVCGVRAGTAGT